MIFTPTRPRWTAFVPITVLSLALAGCTQTQRVAQPVPPQQPPAPASIEPVQTERVQSNDLPPIAGTTTTQSTVGAQAQTGGNGGFGSLASVDGGTSASASGGRDLSGPLSMQQLLGGWTVRTAGQECRLNLTYTAKGATGRYRASVPNCGQETLSSVTSWQLLGTQIQLYNEADEIVGTMARSGNRFVGALAGGQSLSMVG